METVLDSVLTPSFLYSVIRVATPLLLASLGAVITSNAGITNIGIEGVMLISALAGVFASAFGFGPGWAFHCHAYGRGLFPGNLDMFPCP